MLLCPAQRSSAFIPRQDRRGREVDHKDGEIRQIVGDRPQRGAYYFCSVILNITSDVLQDFIAPRKAVRFRADELTDIQWLDDDGELSPFCMLSSV